MNSSLGLGLKAWLGSKNTDFAKVMLKALSVGCPNGQSHEHCQLFDIRSWTQQARIDWVNSLSDEQVSAIYAGHYECLKNSQLVELLENPAV